jgi:hypothetical protein
MWTFTWDVHGEIDQVERISAEVRQPAIAGYAKPRARVRQPPNRGSHAPRQSDSLGIRDERDRSLSNAIEDDARVMLHSHECRFHTA